MAKVKCLPFISPKLDVLVPLEPSLNIIKCRKWGAKLPTKGWVFGRLLLLLLGTWWWWFYLFLLKFFHNGYLKFFLMIFLWYVLQKVQGEREEKLKVAMLAHIQPYVEGHDREFVQWAKDEKEKLKDACKHWVFWELISLYCPCSCGWHSDEDIFWHFGAIGFMQLLGKQCCIQLDTSIKGKLPRSLARNLSFLGCLLWPSGCVAKVIQSNLKSLLLQVRISRLPIGL